MEHLLKKEQMLHFHNILKYMIFQRRQKALLWSIVWNSTFSILHGLEKQPDHDPHSFSSIQSNPYEYIKLHSWIDW